MPLDFPDQIHSLAANESEDFIIFNNHGNPFVDSTNFFNASSVDTARIGVETVDDDDDTSSDSEENSSIIKVET